MERNRKLILAKCAVVAGAIPLLLWAHEYGPDPGYSGVPGENGTCASALCHVGKANNPVNTGSVTVTFPAGNNYTAGVKQHLVVTIYDPVQHAWGFQLTARMAGSPSTMAGTFASTDQNTLVMCSVASLTQLKEMDFGAPQTCPSNMPLQYIEHSLAGYNATKGQPSPGIYEFDWTPPASATGDITIYVAANAANGDLTANGDHIYTTTYTLSPLATSGPPAIAANGVVSAGAFGGFPTVAPGSWMEIYGNNLSGTTRLWAGKDFVGLKAPQMLDGVSVTIGGKQAFIDYVSPGQVNAQVPSDVPTGAQQMTVNTAAGSSSDYGITVNSLQPGLLAPGSFLIGGKQYVVATFSDGSFVLPPGSIAGLTTRQAKPGETVILYGVGFGPVKDSGGQNIPAGTIVQAVNQLANSFTLSIGGSNATVGYAGLAPNYVGLYQFNVVVPNIANNDLAPVKFSLNGAAGTQGLYLAVKQ